MVSPSLPTASFGVEGWVQNFPVVGGFRHLREASLAFPAGRAPGLDPSHPAAKEIRFSGIVHNANYINALTGQNGTLSGAAVTHKMINALGHVCVSSGFFGDMRSVFPAVQPITLGQPFTFAGFVMTTNTPGYAATLFSNAANTNTYGAAFAINGGGWSLALNGSVTLNGSNTIFAQDRPMFWAASFFNGAGRVVSRDLWSGVLRFENFGWDPAFKHQPGAGGASCMTQGGVSIQGYYGAEMWNANFMSMAELIQWSQDPWAFWYPKRNLLYSPYAATAAVVVVIPKEYLRPDSDDSISDWKDQAGGTTNIYLSIDETPYSDTDYIKSPSPPNSSVARFRLSDPTAGQTLVDPVIVRYRFKKTTSDDQQLIVSLKQGAALIASWTHTGAGLTESFQTVEQTLSSGQLAAITDFNDLYIEFQATPP